MTDYLLAAIILILLYPSVKPWLRGRLIRWRNQTGRTR